MAERVVSMDVRLAVAFFRQTDAKVTVTTFCAEQGVSRKSFYEYRRRFDEGGLEALVPRSRRPLTSPTATGPEMIALILDKRQELCADGLDHGARSIRAWLRRAGQLPPSARTIHRILVSHGLIEPQPRKRPRRSFRRFAHSRANECWQMDGHDRRL